MEKKEEREREVMSRVEQRAATLFFFEVVVNVNVNVSNVSKSQALIKFCESILASSPNSSETKP